MKEKQTYPALLILSGPTASGKSSLAESIAEAYKIPIISADSRQIYKYFNIGTAKPDPAILKKLDYEMIDIIEPEESFSAGKFAREAARLIRDKYRHKPVVMIAGGTGFYIEALLKGLPDIPEIDEEIDKKWNNALETDGLQFLQEQIKTADPEYHSHGDLSNPQRLLRALKIVQQTGRSIFSFSPVPVLPHTPVLLEVAIRHEREELYRRIDQRVDRMVEKGLVEEVENLLIHRDTPAMRTVGYRELLPYFDGKISLEEALGKIKQHSRNYAKRQWTWFRKHGQWEWIRPDEKDLIKKWLQKIL